MGTPQVFKWGQVFVTRDEPLDGPADVPLAFEEQVAAV